VKPSSAKAKGRETENLAADFAALVTGRPIERRRTNGPKDRGDLAGFPTWLAVEVKSSMSELDKGMDQAMVEALNADAQYPLLVARRKRSDVARWYAGMPYLQMLQLIMELEAHKGEA
jgi:hypothetical protein